MLEISSPNDLYPYFFIKKNSKNHKLQNTKTHYIFLLKNADCKTNKAKTYIALIPIGGHK